MNVTAGNLLQTQCQLLPPLSHIVSVLNGKRSHASLAHKTHSQKKSERIANENSKEEELLCIDSFNEALKSVNEIFSNKSCRMRISSELSISNFNEILTKIYNKRRAPQPIDWFTSHTSRWSFEDNKRYGNHTNSALFSTFFRSLYHQNYCIRRDFNTRTEPYVGLGSGNRSTKSRFGLSALGDSKFSLFKSKKDKNMSAADNQRLKAMISDEHMNNDEKQRLKVAFAEGYLAAEPKARSSSKWRLSRDFFLIALIMGIMFFFMGGSFRRVLIGSTNEVHPEDIDVTFNDVKGVDEAKQELQEVVEFLRNPDKFSALGGKLPKGVLLVGPPGTGKTLLARAVAGEAGVPFFHAAGPEFDEILVGQGARRVRDLFSTAKLRAPCVVFIDEIDSVGAKRTNSVLHPYANQTINQLLTEMDGFRQNEGVIVLGATNRRDDLDRALLRPGRFDVEVQVPIPDFIGRKEILELYLGKVKLADDVDVEILARGTTGFTGADLENMVNQSALRAAIDAKEAVTMKYLENSRDKILMGPERKNRIPDEEANVITAYHEGGHALVSFFTKEANPIHKVTIVPRGPSLGHTAYIPEKERYHITKAQMMATMDTLMGGRAAEELIFGLDKITTGAADDLRKATLLATNMVKEWGMSEKIGVRTFEEDHNSLIVVNELAATTAENIDSEIKRLLQDSYERAKNILKNHSKEHKLLAEALIKYETLNATEVKAIMAGKEPKL